MTTATLDKLQPVMVMTDSPPIYPLDTFVPEIDLESFDFPALVWPVDKSGRRMAVGLCAMGFTVGQTDDLFSMRLDATADRLLLKLYDVAAGVRWHSPERGIEISDRSEADEQEVQVVVNGGDHE